MSDRAVKKWVRGSIAAFVGGGAGAVSATTTTCTIAPDKFNPSTQLKNFLFLLFGTFLMGAISHLFFYLARSPIWDDDTEVDESSLSQIKPTNQITKDHE